uniref:Cob(II)yrinic acid a,c-diamide reductase n=1 Tax=Candidatus Kentrum sp. MB TaxID=2138164 RepID=A0A451B894_9GAMM|nr:MAG: cob(II)yrinic acid a,c-diamide reductase [Candidatus Kentron sp. MB]VFK27988.1 MAG: cob(II)yrinic acid a,c-diamide reductase [Candidatus Kentron sp. MB]VFK74504.1 MAG: cob(II)yrinic acid a,c-diamide reductase [Candidatus Kentron sp. MB]
MSIEPFFTQVEQDAVYKVIQARRDIRHFAPGEEVHPETLARILQATHQAPSVGLMQPWRFIRIHDPELRRQLKEEANRERLATAHALGERQNAFLKLKIEGISECAELLVMVMAPDDGTILGRRTIPYEMAISSCACAIQNMWLAARAENLGLGWVSFFDPEVVCKLLKCPDAAKPLAILCLGPVVEFPPAPLLIISGWRQGKSLESILYNDYYGEEPVFPEGTVLPKEH